MAYIVMAYMVMACISIAYRSMAYILMAFDGRPQDQQCAALGFVVVMAYIVMAHIYTYGPI